MATESLGVIQFIEGQKHFDQTDCNLIIVNKVIQKWYIWNFNLQKSFDQRLLLLWRHLQQYSKETWSNVGKAAFWASMLSC